MGIIKVDTKGEVTVHDFPTGSTHDELLALKNLIGCDMIEHVMPPRLYSVLGYSNDPTDGNCISMLVDEEGRLRENKINRVGSFLYEADRHGNPIVGNVLFVRDEWTDDGTVFTDIPEDILVKLEAMLKHVNRILKG